MAQRARVERDRDRPEVPLRGPRQRNVRGQRVGRIPEIVPAHPRRGGERPAPAAVQGGRGRGIEPRGRPALQLAQIPVEVRERKHQHADVPADALHLLRVPQGEGVVVAGRHDERVRVHRLQHVAGVVARHGLTGTGSGEPVAGERHEREEEDRRGQRPAPRRHAHAPCQALLDPLHQRREAHSHPHPPCREGRDEEVVPLAHLVLEPGPAIGLGVSPLEVEVEHEHQREREHERRHRERGPALGLPVTARAEQPESGERRGEGALHRGGPVPAELPGEVLQVIEELLPVEDQRVAGVVGAGQIHRIVERRRLAELLAREQRPERLPGCRLALVQVGVEVGADRHEEVDARPDRRHERRRDEEAGREERPRIGPQDVCQHGGRDEDPHQVVRRREREQVHDEDEMVVAPGAGRLIAPPQHEPQHERDGQHADGVHLLVRHRLVPDGERRGADDRARRRGEPPRPVGRHDGAQPALPDEEPEPGRDRARRGGEQIDASRVVGAQREQSPGMGDDHEQRVSRRMRNPERVRGGDVFGGVPKLGRRGERRDVEDESAQRDAGRYRIRRTLFAHGRPGLVPELPDAGEHHRDPVPVGGGDHLRVFHGAARLDDRADPRPGGFFYPVGEWKERVGS